MRFVTYTLREIFFGWSSHGGWDYRVCSTQGRSEKWIRNFGRKSERKRPLRKPRCGWKTIL